MNEKNEVIQINSKEELMGALKQEFTETEGYNQYILVFESRRLSIQYGIFKGEYYEKGDLKYRGGLILPISTNDKTSQSLKVGESKFFGLAFDSKGENIGEVISGLFRRSIKEGKLQDFVFPLIPFTALF